MALVKCPDCGKDLSENAATCLQCGRPMAQVKPSALVRYVRAFIAVSVIVLSLIAALWISGSIAGNFEGGPFDSPKWYSNLGETCSSPNDCALGLRCLDGKCKKPCPIGKFDINNPLCRFNEKENAAINAKANLQKKIFAGIAVPLICLFAILAYRRSKKAKK